jgi:S1-C subfamily serine protease
MEEREPMDTLSQQLAEAVERTSPAIVRIEGRRWAASGVAWSEDIVVTTAHGLEPGESVGVELPGGADIQAQVVGRDPGTDIAVLRSGEKLSPAAFAEATGLRVGHLVLALGRPGRSVRARLGVVSALGEDVRLGGGARLERYLETDIDPRRGFSGGPLVTPSGDVLGISTGALARGALVTLTTPTLRRVVDGLVSGRMKRGYLGISSFPVRLPEPAAQAAGAGGGLLVTGVEPGSPAERGGIFLGDVILALDGQAVTDLGDLLAFLAEDRAGKSVAVKVLRTGSVRELPVSVGERP